MAEMKIQRTTITEMRDSQTHVEIVIADDLDPTIATESVTMSLTISGLPEMPYLEEVQLSALHRARDVIGEQTTVIAPRVRQVR